MRTRITPIEELQKIMVEILINASNGKVTKVSDESVLFGMTYGAAAVGQKAIKDIALIETHIFPNDAYGPTLDNVASDHGISPRFQQGKSSTFVRVIGNPGTQYTVGVHTFTGSHGIVFEIEETFIIDSTGFGYVKIKSQESGAKTKVGPLTLDTVTPVPSGHKNCINEYKAQNGRDVEQDEFFRRRIKEAPNINAQKTLSFMEQLFLSVNENILRVFFYGFNQGGKVELGISTQNGVLLTDSDLDDLLEQVSDRICLTDLRDFGNQLSGISLRNIEYVNIDLDFRTMLGQGADSDTVRIDIQTKLQSKLDYRFWEEGDSVFWDDFFQIVKSTSGVSYLPNKYFRINSGLNDIQISRIKLPRLRSFVMRDLQGNIITSNTGALLPFFYPNNPDKVYSDTII